MNWQSHDVQLGAKNALHFRERASVKEVELPNGVKAVRTTSSIRTVGCFTCFLVITLLAMHSASRAQGGLGVSAEPGEIAFGPHDIGTATPRTLVVKNESTASANLTIAISGDDATDFSWKSTCLSSVPPNSRCDVAVSFSPVMIRKPTDRQAELAISDGNHAVLRVALRGSAFENLGVAYGSLNFDSRQVDTVSAPLGLVVTNYSESTVSNLTVTVAGDFTENHAKCEKIAPGASCAISVVFAPKVLGVTKGSLTITLDQSSLGKLPRVVLLQGNALLRCGEVVVSFWSWRVWLVVLLGGLYFLGLVLVRWHMIAKPARAQLVAAVHAVRARLIAETAGISKSADLDGRVERIHFLLDWALYSFKNKSFPIDTRDGGREKSLQPSCPPWYTRLFNALFWPRGQEIAGWSCVHEAEYELVQVLPAERVRAGMEIAEPQLRVLKTPVSLALADRLHDALASPPSTVTPERQRALLAEALGLIYEQGDTDYFQLASWHAKMMWLVGCALIFIFALAATLQNAILLLLGGVGGLLSRLSRTVQSADVANDYGASWGALFLSPLCGALSAWGGILLIILGLKLNILGSALHTDWCNPYDPATLAIALLFGFSERLFDGIVSQIENKFLKTPPESGTAATSPPYKPAPKITSVSPAQVNLGQSVSFTVKGENFVPGATATLTDEQGNVIPGTLEFTDTATVLVKATLAGQNHYTSTLTITNQDKQSAMFRVSVV